MVKVKIYSTTTCPYCRAEKEYLAANGVEFEEIVLDQQPEAVGTLLDTCGSMGVPCTHITKDDGSEAVILGFDKQRLNAELDIHN